MLGTCARTYVRACACGFGGIHLKRNGWQTLDPYGYRYEQVQAGAGRTGMWWSHTFEQAKLEPDIMIFAKVRFLPCRS